MRFSFNPFTKSSQASTMDARSYFEALLLMVSSGKFQGPQGQRRLATAGTTLASKFVTIQRFLDYVVAGGPFISYDGVDWKSMGLDRDDLTRLRSLVLQEIEKRARVSAVYHQKAGSC